MANTFVAIATVTVGSGGSSTIEFSNIPQTYTDLALYISGRTSYSSDTNDQIRIYLNGITSTYGHMMAVGNGSAKDWDGSQTAPGVNAQTVTSAMTSSVFSNDDIYILDYTSSNPKHALHNHTAENATTTAYITHAATRWNGTNPITSLSISTFRGSGWAQYSSATLYGIKNS